MIILCGLPMSGKTTIGKLLAEKLNWDFLDTDQMIEKAYYQETKQNLTCREIFKKKGEGFFRSLEKEQITTLANYKNVIVALGGGSLIDEENRKFVKSL